MKKIFELWLDESGDFEDDRKLKKWQNPSLVGGVLVESGKIDAKKIIKLVTGKNSFHGTDDKTDADKANQISLLEKIKELEGKLIVYENKEKIVEENSTETYLEVLSQGIIQTIQKLTSVYEEFELKIIAATRVDTGNDTNKANYKKIPLKEYESKLKKKIDIGIAQRTISNSHFFNNERTWNYSIKINQANKQPQCALADAVCNARLTRNTKLAYYKETLNKLYENEYIFSVEPNNNEVYINKLLGDGKVSDAIIEYYAKDIGNSKIINNLINNIKRLNSKSFARQLENVKNVIVYLIDSIKDYNTAKQIIKKLKNEFCEHLDNENIAYDKNSFLLNLNLFLFTVYTHEGNLIDSELLIDECTTYLKGMTLSLNDLELLYIFKTRLAVHLTNCFDFEQSEKIMEELENFLMGIKEVLSFVDNTFNEMSNDDLSEIKFIPLAKALGTKVNSLILNHKHKDYIQSVSTVEKATNEFIEKGDKARQYLNRALLECKYNNIDSAIKYLLKTVDLEYVQSEDLTKFMKKCANGKLQYELYKLYVLMTIVKCAIKNDKKEIANGLFNSFLEEKKLFDELLISEKVEHPLQLVNWKVGFYYANDGKVKESNKHYNKAIEICFRNEKNITMNAIGIGILAEHLSMIYAKNLTNIMNEKLNELEEKMQDFFEKPLPENTRKYFDEWAGLLEKVKSTNDYKDKTNFLIEISSKITY